MPRVGKSRGGWHNNINKKNFNEMKKNIIAAVLTAMLAAATGTAYTQVGFETTFEIVEKTDDFGEKTGESTLLVLAKGKFSNSVVTKETAYLTISMEEQKALYVMSKYRIMNIYEDEATIELKGKTDGETYTYSTMKLPVQQIDNIFSRNDTVDVYVNSVRTGAGYYTKGWFRITGCNQISDLYRKQFNR